MGLLTRNRTFVLKPTFTPQTKVLSDTSDIRGVTYCKFAYTDIGDNIYEDSLDNAVQDACLRIVKAIEMAQRPIVFTDRTAINDEDELSIRDNVEIFQDNIVNTEIITDILEQNLVDIPKDIPKSSRKGDVFPEAIFRRRK